jgi:hypothetical protein
MILRSRKRSNFIGNPSDGTRRISRRRAYVIGIATGLANPRSALSVCESLRSRSAGKTYAQHRRRGSRHYGRCLTRLVFLVAYVFTTGLMVRGYRQIGPLARSARRWHAHRARSQTGKGKQVALVKFHKIQNRQE